jgi:hypothetical protein
MKSLKIKPFNSISYEEALVQEAALNFEAYRKEQVEKLLAKVRDSK